MGTRSLAGCLRYDPASAPRGRTFRRHRGDHLRGYQELMTRVPLVCLMFACAGWMLVVAFQHRATSDPTHRPSSDDAAAWRWVGAEPGANIYFSPLGPQHPGAGASAWVDREFSPGLASVGGRISELWQFDCQQLTSRRLSSARLYRDLEGAEHARVTRNPSGWRPAIATTTAHEVLSAVCENRGERTRTPRRR